MELIHKLGIDWKLLLAQIINFFILLIVLYKFVYRPVLKMLDRRSKMIEKGIRDAKESEEKLLQMEQLREKRMNEAEREIGRLLEKAKTDAETMKKEIVDMANKQAEDFVRRATLKTEEEKALMLQQVKKELTSYIVTVTGKLLERELTTKDQERLAHAIAEEMKTL